MKKLILITSVLFIIQVSYTQTSSDVSKNQKNNIFTVHQNIKTMDRNGSDFGYFLKYSVNTSSSDLEQIKYRIDSTVREIASLYSYSQLIRFEKRDSIDSRIKSELISIINVNNKKIDNLNIKNIGIPKNVKNALLELENLEKDKLNYYKNLKTIDSMIGGFITSDEMKKLYKEVQELENK